jgi:predicted permease
VTVNRSCGWQGCWISSSTLEDYELLRGSLPAFEDLSARTFAQVAIRIGGDAHALAGELVSPNYFDLLGVRPGIGRAFGPDEDGRQGELVAVISQSAWRRLFGADTRVLGQFIEVAGRPARIIGVAPPRFGGSPKGNTAPNSDNGTEIWLPLSLTPSLVPAETASDRRRLLDAEYEIQYVGRLKSGATLEQARADASVATARIKDAHPATHDTAWVQVDGGVTRQLEQPSVALAALMAVPMLVLGIACVNAANLLLARGTQRSREVAVRLALGASRWRVIRQLMTESLLLSMLASALALPLMVWSLALAEAATGLPAPLSGPTLIFTSLATLLCALGFGLAPAVRTARRTAALGSSRMGDQTPSRMRGRRAMVVAQVALSVGLLATASQMIGAVRTLFSITGATDPDRVVLASFDLDQLRMPPAAGESFYRRLLERVGHLPSVESVVLARRSALWTWGRGSGNSPIIVWGPNAGPKDGKHHLGGYVAGDLSQTVGLRLVSGRAFLPEDATANPRTAIVSRAFADSQFKGAAVDGMIRVSTPNQRYPDSVEAVIVGVIEAAADVSYSRRPLQTVYVSRPLQYEPALTLYIRSRVDPGLLAPELRDVVQQLDPRVPILEIATLETLTARRHFEERLMAGALTLLGGIALALATAGLYGLVSFIVTLRHRELGIRMALGASSSEVLRLVLSQSMRLAFIGGALGGGIALVLGAVVHANIVGVPSVDGTLFLAATAVLGTAMLLASVIPARRASLVDPITVLRQE